MITGSGSQNRDEELFDHKPFAVIADDFAKKGIATLRLDDRGIGGSKGANTDTSANFATDINAAVYFLTNKGYTNIG
jgi:alpha/beta superfamily hydrolase